MSAATAAIVFNRMSEENNRRAHEARMKELREAEEKLRRHALQPRVEAFKEASKRKAPKPRQKTEQEISDEIDGEILSSLPSKNGVIRVF